MDRTIVIEVNGSYIRKDSDVAGVRGEANSTIMNIIFDESWEGYAKKVTFWDARGENPVERTLTTDLLTDITVSTLDYSVPIPGEPLVHQGTMTFVIDGFTDGVRKRSASDKLKVKYSPMADTAEEPADPTPTQAEQLQKQIDTMLGDIQTERVQAQEARNEAVNAAEEATASAESASEANESAGMAMATAVEAANVAREAQANIEANAQLAQNAATSASTSAQSASASASSASASANSAGTYSTQTADYAAAAGIAASNAKTAETNARESEAAAKTSETNAKQSETKAGQSESNAKTSEEAAKEAQRLAEKARDEASAVAGGDYPTRNEAQGYANQAETNAKAYTDEQISQIPTPDVSGQISEHNADVNAHPSIRTALGDALGEAKSYTDQKIAAIPAPDVSGQISEHNTDADAHPAIRGRINSLEEKVGDVVLSELDILDYEVVTREEYDSMQRQEDVLYLIEDDPETQAVKEHIVNTDIHVTAEEKEVWNTPGVTEDRVNELIATATAGGVKIATGNYTGNNGYGSSNPNRLSFDFKPMIVIIGDQNYGADSGPLIMIQNAKATMSIPTNAGVNIALWDGNNVSWYNRNNDVVGQMNKSGIKYTYVAIG